MLEFIPNCYKNFKMCGKAVDDYSHALKFAPDCYKTQKCVIMLFVLLLYNVICSSSIYKSDKALATCPFVFTFFLVNIRLEKYEIKLCSKNLLF